MSRIPGFLFLCAAALCAVPADAAKPVVTFEAQAVVVKATPGAEVVLITDSSFSNRLQAFRLTDTDNDGTVRFESNFPLVPGSLAAADVSTGEYAIAGKDVTPTESPLPAMFYPGTDGAISRIISAQNFTGILWIRPGVGAFRNSWFTGDEDKDSNNAWMFLSASGFSTAPPASFQPGDVFITFSSYQRTYQAGILAASHIVSTGVGTFRFGSRNAPYLTEATPATAVQLIRTGGTAGSASVRFRTKDVTAKAGVDYQAVDTVVTFNQGEVVKSVNLVPINDDAYAGGRSTFTIELLDPAGGAAVGDISTFEVPISEDESAPLASIGPAPAPVKEGNTPWKLAIPVKLTGKSRVPAVIDYFSGISYNSVKAGTFTFAPGQTSGQVEITIPADTEVQDNYQLRVSIGVVANVSYDWSTHQVLVDVIDDDIPTVTAADIRVFESGSAAVFIDFEPIVKKSSSVKWRLVDGTAKAGSDYIAQSGTMGHSIHPIVNLSLIKDNTAEDVETFYLELYDEVEATVLRRRIAIHIHDEASGPKLQMQAPAVVTEGAAGERTKIAIRVTRTTEWPEWVRHSVLLYGGTAYQDQDFAVVTRYIDFYPEEMEKTVEVQIIGDDVVEGDETFEVKIMGGGRYPATSKVVAEAMITITDDEQLGSISINGTSALESTNETTDAIFTITLASPIPGEARVDYATQNGTATAGSDYIAASGTLVFAPGETSKDVTVLVLGDSDVEAIETFKLVLTNPVRATLSKSSADAQILDDDAHAKTLSVRGARVTEGTGANGQATFAVLLGAAVTEEVRVSYETRNGTATAPHDYIAKSGTLVFAPGETIKQVSVTIVGDSDDEPNEKFLVVLSNPVNATIVLAQADGHINDDDLPPLPKLSVSNVQVREGNSGEAEAVFTLTLSKAPEGHANLDIVTTAGTASAGSDYVHAVQRVVFLPGQTTATFTARVVSDDKFEPDETFTLAMTSSDVALPTAAPVCTILNDDVQPRRRAVRR